LVISVADSNHASRRRLSGRGVARNFSLDHATMGSEAAALSSEM